MANPPPILSQPVFGGYVLVNYKADTEDYGRLFPYFRWQTGRGGFIWERNSPNTSGNAPIRPDGQFAQFQGDLLRFQFQFNY